MRAGVAFLARARGLAPIRVQLPFDLQNATFVEARLVYNRKRSHYEWHFVVDDGLAPVMRTTGANVAVDMGEIHPAVVTDGKTGLVLSVRELRSTGQGLGSKGDLRSGCQKIKDEIWLQTVQETGQGESQSQTKGSGQAKGHSAQSLTCSCRLCC